MKSNLLKYILIGCVVLIWGLIIFRIVSGLKEDTLIQPPSMNLMSFNYAITQDSFSLYADYPDPFLPSEEIRDTIATATDMPVQQPVPDNAIITGNPEQKPNSKAQFDPSSIKYTGMISNPEKKIKMAILKINDQEVMLREKESRNDLVLISIQPGKIVIKRKNKKYEIQREQ